GVPSLPGLAPAARPANVDTAPPGVPRWPALGQDRREDRGPGGGALPPGPAAPSSPPATAGTHRPHGPPDGSARRTKGPGPGRSGRLPRPRAAGFRPVAASGVPIGPAASASG